MEVERAVVGPLATNAYLICEGDECVVVDPGGDPGEIFKLLRRRSVAAVVATHLHFDHVAAVGEVVGTTGAPFYAHVEDWRVYKSLNSIAEEWGFPLPDLPEPRPLGGRLRGLEVWHTPGHTPGSVSLVGPGFVLTGDTLFKESVGRADLPHGDWRRLIKSVCRLYSLPEEYVVYPGHGPPTTIGDELRGNLFVNYLVCQRMV
ncbi:MAG: MBL fold metallo-hydrolase [Pyrobaculum sp.]